MIKLQICHLDSFLKCCKDTTFCEYMQPHIEIYILDMYFENNKRDYQISSPSCCALLLYRYAGKGVGLAATLNKHLPVVKKLAGMYGTIVRTRTISRYIVYCRRVCGMECTIICTEGLITATFSHNSIIVLRVALQPRNGKLEARLRVQSSRGIVCSTIAGRCCKSSVIFIVIPILGNTFVFSHYILTIKKEHHQKGYPIVEVAPLMIGIVSDRIRSLKVMRV